MSQLPSLLVSLAEMAGKMVCMLIMLPFACLWRVVRIFGGFTFTIVEDYGPLLTLVIGLFLVARIRGSRQEKATLPLVMQMAVSCLWPVLPSIGVFFLAREFWLVRGSWPQVLVYDPQFWLGRVSPRYDRLYHLTNYPEAYSGAWMVVSLTAFFALRARFSAAQQWLFGIVTFLSVLVFIVDPGHRYFWWVD